MKVAIAADHAGCTLMPVVVAELRALGCEVLDLGTHDATNGDDYPDHAVDLARAILDGRAERGVRADIAETLNDRGGVQRLDG